VNTQAWNRYNHLQRFARLRDAVKYIEMFLLGSLILANVISVFDYYRRADIITAYQTTYRALNQFWYEVLLSQSHRSSRDLTCY